jgi:hypothetical protein
MADQYADMQKIYKRSAEDLQNEINRDVEVSLAPVQKKLSDFLEAYANRNNIVLILNVAVAYQSGALAYATQAIDITDDFIAEYNKANPVPGAAAAPARSSLQPRAGQ